MFKWNLKNRNPAAKRPPLSQKEFKMINIQHTTLESLTVELDQIAHDIVRINGVALARPGQYGSGGQYQGVQVQTVNEAGHILTCFVTLGVWRVMHGKPFSPEAQRKANLTAAYTETAVDLITDYIQTAVPGVVIMPGFIHTGLEFKDRMIAYWDGFEDHYKLLKGEGNE